MHRSFHYNIPPNNYIVYIASCWKYDLIFLFMQHYIATRNNNIVLKESLVMFIKSFNYFIRPFYHSFSLISPYFFVILFLFFPLIQLATKDRGELSYFHNQCFVFFTIKKYQLIIANYLKYIDLSHTKP